MLIFSRGEEGTCVTDIHKHTKYIAANFMSVKLSTGQTCTTKSEEQTDRIFWIFFCVSPEFFTLWVCLGNHLNQPVSSRKVMGCRKVKWLKQSTKPSPAIGSLTQNQYARCTEELQVFHLLLASLSLSERKRTQHKELQWITAECGSVFCYQLLSQRTIFYFLCYQGQGFIFLVQISFILKLPSRYIWFINSFRKDFCCLMLQ